MLEFSSMALPTLFPCHALNSINGAKITRIAYSDVGMAATVNVDIFLKLVACQERK